MNIAKWFPNLYYVVIFNLLGKNYKSLEASSKLEDHVDGWSCFQVVIADLLVVRQLLSSKN